jgi:hypothetical protein
LPITVSPLGFATPLSSTPADSTDVIVWGAIGAALLFVPLIGLLAATSLRVRLPMRKHPQVLPT